MPLKDILVVVDDTGQGEAVVRLAAQLAHRSRAHLVGACAQLGLEPEIFETEPVETFAGGVITAARDDHRAQAVAAERVARAEALLHDIARVHGLTDEWHDVAGDPLGPMLTLARRTDLVVIGQLDPARRVPAELGDLAEGLLMSSGRPVLFVPYIGAPATPPQRALICWDDSRAAARALADALPLLDGAEATVLSIDPSPTARAGARAVAAHLIRHGVRAATEIAVSDGIPVAQTILNHASDTGAQLVVMGGYGHTRTREHLLGGVTFELLKTMTVPILMSH